LVPSVVCWRKIKEGGGCQAVEVSKLGDSEKHGIVNSLLKKIEEDDLPLLQKLLERVERTEVE